MGPVMISLLIASGVTTSTTTDATLRGLAQLAAPSVETRLLGVATAAQTGDAVFIDPLIALATASEASERAAAAKALGDLGVPRTTQDLEKILRALLRLASDQEDSVSFAAIQSLARYPFPFVATRTIESVQASPTRSELARQVFGRSPSDLRQRMTRWAEIVGKPATSPTSPEERFGRPSNDPVLAAAELISLGDKRTAAVERLPAEPTYRPFFERALRDENEDVRLTATSRLVESPFTGADDLLATAFADPSSEVRATAAPASGRSERLQRTALRRLSIESDQDVIEPLVEALQTAELEVVVEELSRWTISPWNGPSLFSVLKPRAGPDVLRLMVKLVATGHDPKAAAWLATLPDEAVLPPVTSELIPADPRARKRLLEIICDRTSSGVVDLLLSQLAGGHRDELLIRRLDREQDPATTQHVLALLASQEPTVREAALAALSSRRGPEVSIALGRLLQEYPHDTAAFTALLSQQPEHARAPLLELLGDPQFFERWHVILTSLVASHDPSLAWPIAQATHTRPDLSPTARIYFAEVTSDRDVLSALGLLAASPLLPQERLAYVDLLSSKGGLDAVHHLRPLANDPELDVKLAVRARLHALKPRVFPAWDPYGRFPLVAEGTVIGASALLLAADISDANLSPIFTGLAGGVLGGATPFLLTRHEDVSLGQAGFFGSSALWGTMLGWGVAGSLELEAKGVGIGTLVGELTGTGLGALFLKQAEWGWEDFTLVNVVGLEASILGGLTSELFEGSTPFHHAITAGALATIPAMIFTRDIQLRDDAGWVALGAGAGALGGLFFPGAIDGSGYDPSKAFAGALAGQALGTLLSIASANLVELSPDQAIFGALGSGFGASLLGGLGLVLESGGADVGTSHALAAAGAWAGTGLALLGDRLHLEGTDPWIVGLATVAGGLAGARAEVHAEQRSFDDKDFPGGILMGSALGFSAGLLVSQWVDASDAELLRSVGGAIVFGAGGAGAGRLFELRAAPRGLITGVSALAGTLITAPFARDLVLEAPQIELALAYGAGAAIAGGLAATYVAPNATKDDPYFGGAVAGASLGVISGIWASQSLERSGLALTTMGLASGLSVGTGLGLSLDLDDGVQAGLTQSGLLLGAVGSRLILELTSKEREAGLYPSALGLALLGGFEGWAIARSLDSDPPPAAILAGTGFGIWAGTALALGSDDPPASIDLLESGLYGALGAGTGLGLGALAGDDKAGAAMSAAFAAMGMSTAYWLTPSTRYSFQDALPIMTATGIFGTLGAVIPDALDLPRDRQGAGLAFGSSLGALAGAAYAQWQPKRDELEIVLHTSMLAALGSGLAQLGSTRGSIGIELGGWTGLTAATLVAPWTSYDLGDISLMSAGAIVGAEMGSFVPALLGKSGAEAPGALMGLGLGYLGTSIATQWSEPVPEDVVETALFGVTMGTGAFGLSQALDASKSGEAAAVELSATLGLLGGFLLAPATEYDNPDYALTALSMGLFTVQGGLIPELWGDGPEWSGALFGASAGLLTGLWASQPLDLTGSDVAETAVAALAGESLGLGAGLLWTETDRGAVSGSVLGSGLGLGLGMIASRALEVTSDDASLIGLISSVGAVEGGILSTFELENPGAAALFGAGVGAVSSLVLSQALDRTLADQGEALIAGLYGAAVGSGAWLVGSEEFGRPASLTLAGASLAAFGSTLLWARETTYSETDRWLAAELTILGAWHGSTLRTLLGRSTDNAVAGGLLFGAGTLGLTGTLLGNFVELSSGDLVEVGLASVLGNVLGYGLGSSFGDEKWAAGLANVFGLPALALGIVFAPDVALDDEAVWAVGGMGVVGATVGGLTPTLWKGSLSELGDAAGSGVAFGASAGALIGVGMNQLGVTRSEARSAAFGSVSGGVLGSGLGMMASEDDRLLVGLMQGLTLAGGVIGGVSDMATGLRGQDVLLGIGEMGYLTWHALGVSLLLEGTDRQSAGAVLAATGAGSALGALLIPHLRLNGTDLWMLFAGSVWGGWIGGWGGELIDAAEGSSRRNLGYSLVSTVLGSDVGMGLVSLVVSRALHVEPTRFAVINLSGLGGMMLGMLAAGFAKDEPLGIGNVAGSLVGLVGGSIVTSFFDFSEAPSPYDAAHQEAPKKVGQVIEVVEWMPSVSAADDGDGLMFRVAGTFR